MQELNVKQLVKEISADKKITQTELATKIGVNQGSLSGMLGRNVLRVDALRTIFEALDEDIVLVLKNGRTIKLVK